MSFALTSTLSSVALILALAAPAFADIKQGDKPKVPETGGQSKDAPGPEEKKNPLPGIIELMKQVEKKIVETDTGRWTQEEQDKIANALKGEGDAVDSLRKLIEEVESQAQQGGGGGDQQQQQQKQQQQGKGQKKQQPMKERGQDEQNKPMDPAARDKAEQEKRQREQKQKEQQQNQNQSQNDKKSSSDPSSADYKLDKKGPGAGAEVWGTLPPKAQREVLEAKRREPPVEWRKQLEDYYRKLAQPKK